MLEASVWTPARDARGHAVAYSGTFDCAFEHPGGEQARTVEPGLTPPVQPELGLDWYERYGGGYLPQSDEARLKIVVDAKGQVTVLGVVDGDSSVASACRRALTEGPSWQPARNAAGHPVPFELTFPCRVQLNAQHRQLVLDDVGSSGALDVETIGASLGNHIAAFTHCFESAFGMSKWVDGTHWVAFEVAPSGAVGRVEWVDRPSSDGVLEECVFSALRALRFPAAGSGTLADVQLRAGGVAKLQFTL